MTENQNTDSTYEAWLSKHGGYANSITLRDYFAAKAMQGFAARDVFDNGLATPYQRANLAYIEADAMLKARGQ